jgi:hypothetical protein
MKDEIFREPLESLGPLCVYTWNEHKLFQMQWVYSIEWLEGAKLPKLWIMSYTCWQRQTPDAPFEEVDQVPFDVPMSESILYRLAEHAGKELYRRSLIVGSLRSVPQNFLARAEEAAEKGYSLELLREMSQREASATTPH